MLNVVLVGILFAAVAMVLNSCGALLQADGARRATRTKPAAIQPRYLAGMLVDLVAWGCAVLALRVLPVFAVQAVNGGPAPATPGGGSRRSPPSRSFLCRGGSGSGCGATRSARVGAGCWRSGSRGPSPAPP